MMRVVTPAPREAWQELLGRSPGALPEQSPRWTDAVAAAGPYTEASRLYEFDDGARAVLPLVRRRGVAAAPGLGVYGSFPPAWGIGGLLAEHLEPAHVRQVLDELRGLRALRVTLCPDPLQAGIWAAACGAAAPGTALLPRRAHVLDLTAGLDQVQAQLPASTRYGIRKAERRGVRVVQEPGGALLPVYHRLRQASLRRWADRQHEPLVLARWRDTRRDPPSKLETLAEVMGEAFVVTVAYVDDRPAAAAIALLDNTAHYTHGVMDRELASTVRANDLLQWSVIRTVCRAGCSAYHLGESGRSTSLARFKERFGATPIDHVHLRLERLPLTRTDSLVRAGVKKLIGFRDME